SGRERPTPDSRPEAAPTGSGCAFTASGGTRSGGCTQRPVRRSRRISSLPSRPPVQNGRLRSSSAGRILGARGVILAVMPPPASRPAHRLHLGEVLEAVAAPFAADAALLEAAERA